MRSLAWAALAALIGLDASGLAAARDAYYPATAGRHGPLWERPKFTHFTAMRCSGDGLQVDQLALNRDDVSRKNGVATYIDVTRKKAEQAGVGRWVLNGERLKMSGAGFVLDGRWTGPFLTATITRPGRPPVRCRFEVIALRSFTDFE